MRTTKIFKFGNSQAVRLPEGFQLDTDEVEILKRGNEIIIREIPKNLKKAFELLVNLPNDFMSERRNDTSPEKE